MVVANKFVKHTYSVVINIYFLLDIVFSGCFVNESFLYGDVYFGVWWCHHGC